jgi:3-phenylpropionate/cinnamic acid dioxygenase small subunit
MAASKGPTLMELQHEIEQFLFAEARLLSERRYHEWLDLFTDDARYRMPVRENRDDNAGIAREDHLAIFEDDKKFLSARVARLDSSLAHAERPPSRVRYYISNVEIEPGSAAAELRVSCNLLVHQSRLEKTETFYVGGRTDLLRRVDGKLRICRREVILDHVLLPRTLSIFF